MSSFQQALQDFERNSTSIARGNLDAQESARQGRDAIKGSIIGANEAMAGSNYQAGITNAVGDGARHLGLDLSLKGALVGGSQFSRWGIAKYRGYRIGKLNSQWKETNAQRQADEDNAGGDPEGDVQLQTMKPTRRDAPEDDEAEEGDSGELGGETSFDGGINDPTRASTTKPPAKTEEDEPEIEEPETPQFKKLNFEQNEDETEVPDVASARATGEGADEINQRFGNLSAEDQAEAMRRGAKLEPGDEQGQKDILDDIENKGEGGEGGDEGGDFGDTTSFSAPPAKPAGDGGLPEGAGEDPEGAAGRSGGMSAEEASKFTQGGEEAATEAGQGARQAAADAAEQASGEAAEEAGEAAKDLAPEITEKIAEATAGSVGTKVAEFLGGAIPLIGPILDAVSIGQMVYSGIKEAKADMSDPFKGVKQQINSANDEVGALQSQVGGDQFQEKIGAGQPAFGSLSAPALDTSKMASNALHF